MPERPRLVFADASGRVFDHPELEAAGMKAGRFFRLDPKRLVRLPDHSELFMLPDRRPVGLGPGGAETALETDPYSGKGEPCFAVAAFVRPGFTLTHSAAYQERSGASLLPLFAYGACAFYKGAFYAAAVRVDRGQRHDESLLPMKGIERGIRDLTKRFPANRLVPHLAVCATVNACANAKNFFLGRIEAPIPTSPVCNAQCQGCISLQPPGRVPPTQKRIQFTPTPEEIAELALFHIERAPDPLVSFGQGCEGEPLLAADTIERSIRLIRSATSKGVINLNSNASRPAAVERLFGAGLNNIRVSLNSVREPYYSRYYQPKGYSLKDVLASAEAARKHGGFVSLNYLSMAGFTDSREEYEALRKLLASGLVNMIQWRNLNYDPLQYFRDLDVRPEEDELIGMDRVLREVSRDFPRLRMGYFNPRKTAVARSVRADSRR